jgi:ligand-binding sensor domain-containing protein
MKGKIIYIFCSLLLGLLAISIQSPLPSQASGSSPWTNYTFDKDVSVLAGQGDILWAGTWGGVLRWDLSSDTYTKYTIADGLADNYIHDIAIDYLGRIWVATDLGLSMYNGTSWTTYDKTNSGIPGESVVLLAVTSDNHIWLHSRDVNGSLGMGVTVYDGSNWITYNTSNSDLSENDIRAIAADQNDHIWVGTSFGDACEFDGVDWTVYSDINYGQYSIYALAVDSQNRKWYISYLPDTRRILIYDGLDWTPLIPSSECNTIIKDIAFGAGDKAWFPTLSQGLCSYDGLTWTRYHTGNSDIAGDTLDNVYAQGSKVWVGFDVLVEGVSEFNGSAWRHIDTADDLPDQVGSWGLAANHETWFGASNGVYVYDKTGWTNYNSGNSGLSDTRYSVIAEDKSDHLWFAGGNYSGGLVEYDGLTTWTQHYLSGIPDPMVFAIAVGVDNRVWAGSRAGLSVYNGSSWTTYNTSNSDLPNDRVESIAIDGAGNVWVACVTRFDGANWVTYPSIEDAIQNNYTAIVNSVDEDKNCWLSDEDTGKVWISELSSGVKYYSGSGWYTYSNSSMGFSPPGTWYAHLAGRDRAGNLWVQILGSGAYHGGLSRFDGVSWTPYKRADGIIDPPGDMTVAHDGKVWFSGSKGFSIYTNPYQPVVKTIWPANGMSLLSIDGSTKINFPAGAVSQPTTLVYTTTLPLPTGDQAGIGHFFAMSSVISGTTTPVTSFSQPYTVTVEYTQDEKGPAIENTLGLYWWDGDAWQSASSTCDVSGNVVTATLDHLTNFAILGDTYRVYLPVVMKNW